MENTASDAAATPAGESPHAAPRSSRGSARSRLLVYTVTEYPASSTWPHIELPMTPVPIQPTRSASGEATAIGALGAACSLGQSLAGVEPLLERSPELLAGDIWLV